MDRTTRTEGKDSIQPFTVSLPTCEGLKCAGALTFLIAWHLEISECPIILSGEQILMKGNCESSAIWAANAVFPL